MEQPINNPLRNSSDPYILLLEEGPFTLSFEKLEDYVDQRDLRRKSFFYPDISFISFEEGMLELKVSRENESYTLAIQVEKDLLQIACNCNTLVHQLCLHAYHALHKLLMFQGEKYFEHFQRNGLVELSQQLPDYFKTTYSKSGIAVETKKELGKLILPTTTLVSFSKVVELSTQPDDNNQIISYSIIHSCKPFHLPFILPYYGTLNKARTEVKSFKDFIRVPEKLPNIPISPIQKLLNSISFEMWQLVHQLPARVLKEPKSLPQIQSLHELWQQALPILSGQTFLYQYYSFRLKFVRQRPIKQYMLPCKIFQVRPIISLQIKEYEDYYNIQLKLTVDGKTIPYKEKDNSFLLWIRRREEHIYLWDLKQAALLEWMGEQQTATVFKVHYNTIYDKLLKYFPCTIS